MSLFFKKNRFAAKEFTEDMLPKNRKEVFFDVMKLHWRSFIMYGLLMLALSLPLHILSVSEVLSVSGILGDGSSVTDEMRAQVFAVKNITAFLKIPCFLLIASGLSGLIKVIRQYAWEENVHFWHDFYSGIKANVLQMLSLALIGGLIYALTVLSFNLSRASTDAVVSVVLMLSIPVSVLIVIPVSAYALAAIPVYSNKFGKQLYIGLALVMANPWRTLLTLLCFLSPLALQMIPSFTCLLIVRFVTSLLFPTLLLAWMLFAFTQFDKHINQTQYPELVGRGVFVKQKDETAEDMASVQNKGE